MPQELIEQAVGALARDLGLPLELAGTPLPLTGGFWATMAVIRLRSDDNLPDALRRELVVRLMPDIITGLYETAVQGLAHDAGVPVAAVHGGGVLDSTQPFAWMVMDLVPGTPLLADISASRALQSAPSLARRLPALLAEVATAVHRCPTDGWSDVLAVTGRDPDVRAFLTRLAEDAELLGARPLALHARRLVEQAPVAGGLCHGDLHPFNLLVDGDRWTLVDWSTAVLADTHYDLAFTDLMLRNPPLGGPTALNTAAKWIGARLAARFLRQYEHRSGRSIDLERLAWGRQVHAVRALIEIEGWRAGGSEQDHLGHPWLTLEPTLLRQLESARGA